MIKSYSELPVGKYLELKELLTEGMDDVELQSSIISILNDMTVDEVLGKKLSEYSELAGKSNFLLKAPELKAYCPSKIILNGHKYKVCKDVRKITAGQYIDYNTYMKMDDGNNKIPEVLSIFIIPDGKKYNDGYDIEDVQSDISEGLDVQTALNMCFFFRKKSRFWEGVTLTYLVLMMKLLKRKMSKEQKMEMEKAIQMLKEMEALHSQIDGLG